MPAKNHSAKYPYLSTQKSYPFPQTLLTTSPWNNFLKNNGYTDFSRNLKLRVYNNLTKCQELWQEFSNNESIYDLWTIRASFYSGYKFAPYFLTIFQNVGKSEVILAVLPLWFNENPTFGSWNSDYRKYVWFGSNWPENNQFFVKSHDLIPLMLLAAPHPTELACIKPLSSYKSLESFTGFSKEEDKKYFLDLSQVKTLDDFLTKLKKKKRYNLRRDRRRILSFSPKTIIDDSKYLEEMFELSIKRFRDKYPDDPNEYSAFEDERRKNVFRKIVENQREYQVRLITTVINNRVKAVEFGLVYKKTYYAFNAGTDVVHYSGLGVYSNLLVIEDALNLGATKIDFLECDNNWKDSWQLDYLYQYQFKK